MPAPRAFLPAPACDYLEGLEDRIAELESPNSPSKLYTITSANLTAANAVTYAFRFCQVTDLNMTAHSNGVHWYRSDTGALII